VQILSASELERVTRELGGTHAEVERARVRLERTRIRAPFSGKLGARKWEGWLASENARYIAFAR
jgi:multidrug resistance efflux pump